MSCHITSHQIMSYHVTSHHVTSHHITSLGDHHCRLPAATTPCRLLPPLLPAAATAFLHSFARAALLLQLGSWFEKCGVVHGGRAALDDMDVRILARLFGNGSLEQLHSLS